MLKTFCEIFSHLKRNIKFHFKYGNRTLAKKAKLNWVEKKLMAQSEKKSNIYFSIISRI